MKTKPKPKAAPQTVERMVSADALTALKTLKGTLDVESAEYKALDEALKELEKEVEMVEEAAPAAVERTVNIEEEAAITRAKAAGATDAVLEILRSVQAENKVIREMAQVERNERLLRVAVDRAASEFKDLGKHAEVGKVLRAAQAAMEPADFTALETILRTAQGRIERADDLDFEERGGPGAEADTSQLAILRSKAEEVMKADPNLHYGDAISRVLRKHPELHDAAYYGEED
jgi:hypothetical protein